MTDSTDDIDQLATITAETETTVLFADGEMVSAGEGEYYCSEHGNLMHDDTAHRRCDHSYNGAETPEPSIEATELLQAIENDQEALEQAAELLAERYPEDLAEIAAPLFDE